MSICTVLRRTMTISFQTTSQQCSLWDLRVIRSERPHLHRGHLLPSRREVGPCPRPSEVPPSSFLKRIRRIGNMRLLERTKCSYTCLTRLNEIATQGNILDGSIQGSHCLTESPHSIIPRILSVIRPYEIFVYSVHEHITTTIAWILIVDQIGSNRIATIHE